MHVYRERTSHKIFLVARSQDFVVEKSSIYVNFIILFKPMINEIEIYNNRLFVRDFFEEKKNYM